MVKPQTDIIEHKKSEQSKPEKQSSSFGAMSNNVNQYAVLKLKNDIKKKQKVVTKLTDLLENKDSHYAQWKKDLDSAKDEIQKLESLEKILN